MIAYFDYTLMLTATDLVKLLLLACLAFGLAHKQSEIAEQKSSKDEPEKPKKKVRWNSSGPDAMQLFCDCYHSKYGKDVKVKKVHQDPDRVYWQYNEGSFRKHLKTAWDRVGEYEMLHEALVKESSGKSGATIVTPKKAETAFVETMVLHKNCNTMVPAF